MAAITIQSIVEAGLTPSALAAATGGGDTFVNDGKTFFEIANGGGGSINVTFTVVNGTFTSPQVGTLVKTDNIVAVGAGVTKRIGPFPVGVYNSTSGTIAVAYSGVSSVTVGAFKL